MLSIGAAAAPGMQSDNDSPDVSERLFRLAIGALASPRPWNARRAGGPRAKPGIGAVQHSATPHPTRGDRASARRRPRHKQAGSEIRTNTEPTWTISPTPTTDSTTRKTLARPRTSSASGTVWKARCGSQDIGLDGLHALGHTASPERGSRGSACTDILRAGVSRLG